MSFYDSLTLCESFFEYIGSKRTTFVLFTNPFFFLFPLFLFVCLFVNQVVVLCSEEEYKKCKLNKVLCDITTVTEAKKQK